MFYQNTQNQLKMPAQSRNPNMRLSHKYGLYMASSNSQVSNSSRENNILTLSDYWTLERKLHLKFLHAVAT